MMDQNVKQHESGKSKADINIVMREIDNADDLRTYLQMHGGEKPNKCNQCDFACSDPSSLSQHLKMHSGEKSNKCNQCDYASSRADNLKTHFKTHSAK